MRGEFICFTLAFACDGLFLIAFTFSQELYLNTHNVIQVISKEMYVCMLKLTSVYIYMVDAAIACNLLDNIYHIYTSTTYQCHHINLFHYIYKIHL